MGSDTYISLGNISEYFVGHTVCGLSAWVHDYQIDAHETLSTIWIFFPFFFFIVSSRAKSNNRSRSFEYLNWINMNFMCANKCPAVPNVCIYKFIFLFVFFIFSAVFLLSFGSCFVFRFDGPVSGMHSATYVHAPTWPIAWQTSPFGEPFHEKKLVSRCVLDLDTLSSESGNVHNISVSLRPSHFEMWKFYLLFIVFI